MRGATHHVRPAVGALAPEDVVLGDEKHHAESAELAFVPEGVVPGGERIRVCGERRTTSGLSPGAPATPTPTPVRRAGLFLRLCFSSIYKKGIMKWPDWRGADSDEGKGREASNL